MSAPELTLVKLSPTADSRLRWADGTLKGVKMLRWRKGLVESPHHTTVWLSAQLDAVGWADGDAVRNQGGIHAIWPQGWKMTMLRSVSGEAMLPHTGQSLLCSFQDGAAA